MTTLKPLLPCKFCGEKDVLDQSYAYCSGCMTLRPVPTSKDDRSDPWRTKAEEALREARAALESTVEDEAAAILVVLGAK